METIYTGFVTMKNKIQEIKKEIESIQKQISEINNQKYIRDSHDFLVAKSTYLEILAQNIYLICNGIELVEKNYKEIPVIKFAEFIEK